jgi:hypothetical protein
MDLRFLGYLLFVKVDAEKGQFVTLLMKKAEKFNVGSDSVIMLTKQPISAVCILSFFFWF